MKLEEVQKPVLYSALEVSKFMGISYNTLYRMIHAGRIKATKTISGNKRKWMLRAEDVQEYYNTQGDGSSVRLEDVHK